MVLLSHEFNPLFTTVGNDEIWATQKDIGPTNLSDLIRDPEIWIRKFEIPGLPGKFPQVQVTDPYCIQVHFRTPGVPANMMLVQVINRTNVVNVYLPKVLDAAHLTDPGHQIGDLELNKKTGITLIFDSDAVLTDATRPGNGQMFLHFPTYRVGEPLGEEDKEQRAYVIAKFHLDLAKDYTHLAKVGGDMVRIKPEVKVWYRVGKDILPFEEAAEIAKIPFDSFDATFTPTTSIMSMKGSYAEACEILVARYLAGQITFEEAYCKAYAGP